MKVITAPIPLTTVARRSEPRDLQLLRWYLDRDYLGDIGHKSPCGRQLEEAQLLRGTKAPAENTRQLTYDPSDEILAAASRLREVEERWHRLSRRHQLALRIRYGDARHPLPSWGPVGAIVPHLKTAHAAWRDSGTDKALTDWLAGLTKKKAEPKSKALAAALRREAEALLSEAVRAWDATGGRR